MQILLAAGIFFPDVGGPAIHVEKIAERLSKEGISVSVLAYGDDSSKKIFSYKVFRVSRKMPKLLQWLSYFFMSLLLGVKSKAIYAFDPTSAGIPACLAAIILRKPFLIRVGGDPIWERVVETGKRFLTIEEYYGKKLYLEDKPILYKIIRFVLKQARTVVVYNKSFSDFYSRYFSVLPDKIKIVKNPVFVREKVYTPLSSDPQIIFAGRFVAYKNLPLVMRAFKKLREKLGKGRLLLIGKGPEKELLIKLSKDLSIENSVVFIDSLPQEKLFEYIKNGAFSIAPALNEFNPNFILESLSFGKPVLLSRGHGLSVDLPEQFLFNPKSEDELVEKMEHLLNGDAYLKELQIIHSLPLNQTWEMVTDFHFKLIKETCIS